MRFLFGETNQHSGLSLLKISKKRRMFVSNIDKPKSKTCIFICKKKVQLVQKQLISKIKIFENVNFRKIRSNNWSIKFET